MIGPPHLPPTLGCALVKSGCLVLHSDAFLMPGTVYDPQQELDKHMPNA